MTETLGIQWPSGSHPHAVEVKRDFAVETEPLIEGIPRTMVGKAYEDYLINHRTTREVAATYGLSPVALATIARKNKWAERRATLDLEDLHRGELSFRKFMNEHRKATAQVQLEMSNSMITQLRRVLDSLTKYLDRGDEDEDLSLATIDKISGAMKRFSEALKAASDVGARAVGLTDAPMSDSLQRTGNAPTPMVVLDLSAKLPEPSL